MTFTEILARYLHEMSAFPERPECLYEDLLPSEQGLYRRKAEALFPWLAMHNYYFINDGGKTGQQDQR